MNAWSKHGLIMTFVEHVEAQCAQPSVKAVKAQAHVLAQHAFEDLVNKLEMMMTPSYTNFRLAKGSQTIACCNWGLLVEMQR